MSNSEINHDNKDDLELFLKYLDNDIVKTSVEILENESAKEEADIDLNVIDECVENILEIKGKNILTQEEISQRIARINEKCNVKNNRKYPKLYRGMRITACIVAIILTLQLAPMVLLGFNPAERLYQLIVSQFAIGESVVEDGIVYVYQGKEKVYNSIDNLLQNESLNILYPSKLPHGINIKDVRKYNIDDYERITINFTSDELWFNINEQYKISNDDLIKYDELSINEILFYLFEKNNQYQAICYHNEYEYIITHSDYDILIEIISNLKEN